MDLYEPNCPMLWSFYKALKKHEKSLKGSPAYEDFKEIYETLDFDLKEEKQDESIASA